MDDRYRRTTLKERDGIYAEWVLDWEIREKRGEVMAEINDGRLMAWLCSQTAWPVRKNAVAGKSKQEEEVKGVYVPCPVRQLK